jgi:acylphosphatase
VAKHLNIRIAGKVQGVFFRVQAVETARDLGIAGFVRNDPDGTVYIEAEGIEEALKEFVEWCHKGPESAEIESVSIEEGGWVGFEDFKKVRSAFF